MLTRSTADVTVLSGSHGRARRAERSIEKVELQAAIKYGRKEPANPGRRGDPRWRYEHNGVVYITDETSRHEITSWRLDDASINLAVGAAEGGAHAVLVVDHLGSMRKADVNGYETRTAAVYDCLARDFVEAQIAAGAGPDVVVTVIEMSREADVIIDKAPLDAQLAQALKMRARSRARSDGNYLPALDKALEILQADASNRGTLMLLFLSDGAPSDHCTRRCNHGFPVWQSTGALLRNGKQAFRECPLASPQWQCRADVKKDVDRECLQKVVQIGDLLGRDRVVVGTVAFAPPQPGLRGVAHDGRGTATRLFPEARTQRRRAAHRLQQPEQLSDHAAHGWRLTLTHAAADGGAEGAAEAGLVRPGARL